MCRPGGKNMIIQIAQTNTIGPAQINFAKQGAWRRLLVEDFVYADLEKTQTLNLGQQKAAESVPLPALFPHAALSAWSMQKSLVCG